jgi:hypothetical protein
MYPSAADQLKSEMNDCQFEMRHATRTEHKAWLRQRIAAIKAYLELG